MCMNSRPVRIPGQGKEEDHGKKGEDIWDQRNNGNKLGQVCRRPCSLQISAAMIQGHSAQPKRKDVALN